MQSDLTDRFNRVGALLLKGAALGVMDELRAALSRWPDGQSGTRIAGDAELARLLDSVGQIGSAVAGLTGKTVFPVRAVYFDKNDTNNWSLAWHQDRTLAVAARCELPGFGPWTTKQGILHVQPPFPIIAAMRTVRIHLDAVPKDNGPLLIARGSHLLGLIEADRCREVAESCGVTECLADAGDIWVYHTPILHASERSSPGQRRRVLQVDYGSDPLPAPLEWLRI